MAQVDQYFQDSGRPARDLPAMYAKTVALPGWFAAFYAHVRWFKRMGRPLAAEAV